MKIEWDIEGAGCHYAQCGMKSHKVEIPDDELPDAGPDRDKFIDEWIEEEFKSEVYFVWREV